MLSLGPPRRDALLSPLPRGQSPWGSLNSPTSFHSGTTSYRVGYLDSASPVSSSRPETPTLIPRWRSGRHGSGAGGGAASTVIESWGSGGVMLENAAAKIPESTTLDFPPQTRAGNEYSQSIFSAVDSIEGSRVGTPRSPRELHRMKGSMSLLRMQSMRSNEAGEPPMRIKSQRSLEKEGKKRESMYKSPTVESAEEDAFFTGACTPEPRVTPKTGNGGENVTPRPKSLGKEGVMTLNGYMRGPPPMTQEEKSRHPLTIVEDVPDCYTPTPEAKGPKAKSILDPQDDELDGTTAATKSANGKESVKSSVSPSAPSPTLLRLKYPSTHHATIEIQHREGIRITTSGRGGSGGGGSKISIQVDMDNNSGSGYTSTIRTGGKRGSMSVTVRPSPAEKSEVGLTTAAIAPSSKRNDGNESAEDGEEELIVAAPPSATKKSRPKSHHRHSHHSKSDKYKSVTSPITPLRQQSMNLIDLSGSGNRGGLGDGLSLPVSQDGSTMSFEMWKTVRKMEKSNDLKRESALMNEAQGQGWSLLDRPISLQKRTSAPYDPITPTPFDKQNREPANLGEGDEAQTVIYDEDQESASLDNPTLRNLPGGKKPRPLSNSNVPVEVALTMGFRGVSGSVPTVGVLEEPPIPGMVPVMNPGSMGMEEMAGGWI
ncbi:hypothetical protein EV426DRAFT_578583 [Tirmania nivea]|nr:hypothetical protein EV426DRAFT_578583 [Tirmania nivea]